MFYGKRKGVNKGMGTSGIERPSQTDNEFEDEEERQLGFTLALPLGAP